MGPPSITLGGSKRSSQHAFQRRSGVLAFGNESVRLTPDEICRRGEESMAHQRVLWGFSVRPKGPVKFLFSILGCIPLVYDRYIKAIHNSACDQPHILRYAAVLNTSYTIFIKGRKI